jgi:hypothetical protein
MKIGIKILALSFTIISLSQLTMAEPQSDEIEVKKSSKAKPLKVEEGATRLGETKNDTDVKTRGLSLVLEPKNRAESANMNIGKVEFYVK